jgi:hypothetical protein
MHLYVFDGDNDNGNSLLRQSGELDILKIELDEDEIRLIEIVREIKKHGFGEFICTIVSKEIMSARQTHIHKFN